MQAIALQPHSLELMHNIALTHEENKSLNKALHYYQQVLILEPNFAPSLINLTYLAMKICDWELFSSLRSRFDQLIDYVTTHNIAGNYKPFSYLGYSMDGERCRQVAQLNALTIKQTIQHIPTQFTFEKRNKDPNRKLRIGYLSNRFRDCATGHLSNQLFPLHNKEQFHVTCYSYGETDDSRYYHTIKDGCDNFSDVRGYNNLQLAQQIYKDEIDILIDLKGHTEGQRMEVSALRPTPLIVHYLGFSNSTGADYIDYYLGDSITLPPEHFSHFTETPILLPQCYLTTDNQQNLPPTPSRQACNLPEDGFIFACFSQTYKIEPEFFTLWMQLLKEADNSVLWLFKSNELADKHLLTHAKAAGIDEERIIFANNTSKEQHLARLQQVDLMLDTKIYGCHTTAVDALWANVPILTCIGKHFPSRVCASVLHAINLPQLITQSTADYYQKALFYATHPEELSAIKEHITTQKYSSPLFDSASSTHNKERAYRTIWEQYCNNLAPCPVTLP